MELYNGRSVSGDTYMHAFGAARRTREYQVFAVSTIGGVVIAR